MRLLAICPRIRKDNTQIVARTAWRVRLLLLGLLDRKVMIDPSQRLVTVKSRYLWLIRRERKIPFSQVDAVTYGYEDWSPDQILSFAHDSFDWFTVGLRMKDRSEIRLFNFVGEGSFDNHGPFPDWMYWDQFAFDATGSQQKESRLFVNLLSKMIGVTVVRPQQTP